MLSENASAELLHALGRLFEALQSAQLPYHVDGADEAIELRDGIADQLTNYVLPRLVQQDAPLLVVVGGSTGAGKSTLVNSLVGERVTESGVLRPTTRSPVLVHHPNDKAWFSGGRVLPELINAAEPVDATYDVRVVASLAMTPGIAILDAPDVDSIDATNRELASQLLAAADLWLFVTSAARYSDQVPWQYLRTAAERSVAVAVVLDRVSPDGLTEVRGHLARMMSSRGLSDSPLFAVSESPLDVDGLLPLTEVNDIRSWFDDLAANPQMRTSVASTTLDGTVRQTVFQAHDVADAMDEQVNAAELLYTAMDSSFSFVFDAMADSVTDGSLLSGQVASRWHEYLGDGELFQSIEGKVGRLKDRMLSGVRGKQDRAQMVLQALENAISSVVHEAVESASASTSTSWRHESYGEAILSKTPGLDRIDPQTRAKTQRIGFEWRESVQELSKAATADRRMSTSFLAVGVNGVVVAAMIAALTSQADSSSEAGRQMWLARQLLQTVLGPQRAEELAVLAAKDLRTRSQHVMESERKKFEALFDHPDSVRQSQNELRQAAKLTEYARHSDFLEAE